jgi:hypothetical protein
MFARSRRRVQLVNKQLAIIGVLFMRDAAALRSRHIHQASNSAITALGPG